MFFPPRLGAPVVVVTARPDLDEARVVPGTVHGYTVRETGHGVEEQVLVKTRNGQVIEAPADCVLDSPVAYGPVLLVEHVSKLLMLLEPVPADKPF